jgi:hypothetical protein
MVTERYLKASILAHLGLEQDIVITNATANKSNIFLNCISNFIFYGFIQKL